MSKPFKITGPGLYRTRSGRLLRIVGRTPPGDNSRSTHPWMSEDGDSRANDGMVLYMNKVDRDLVALIRLAKRRKAVARWGVWVLCESYADACYYRSQYKAVGRRAVVRKGSKP